MKRLFLIVWLVIFLAGCDAAAATPPAETDSPAPATASETVLTSTPLPPTPTPELELLPLPLAPQRIEFQAEDGVMLVGYYYPAAANPAPVVVLMHEGGGNQTDWLYVGMVSWLQNRGAEIPTLPEKKHFDTPYPFPPLPEDLSFAVFTFDFRGNGESAGKMDRNEFILDARAAYQTAAGLEGVDPAWVTGIGASIGADGVVDSCEACAGALSLGPGDWLGMPYGPAVTAMDDEKKPVLCVAAEDDQTSVQACNGANGQYYQKQIYSAGGHGMQLFRIENNLQPSIETVILDFLEAILGLP